MDDRASGFEGLPRRMPGRVASGQQDGVDIGSMSRRGPAPYNGCDRGKVVVSGIMNSKTGADSDSAMLTSSPFLVIAPAVLGDDHRIRCPAEGPAASSTCPAAATTGAGSTHAGISAGTGPINRSAESPAGVGPSGTGLAMKHALRSSLTISDGVRPVRPFDHRLRKRAGPTRSTSSDGHPGRDRRRGLRRN